MKRFIYLIFSFILIVGLAGCSFSLSKQKQSNLDKQNTGIKEVNLEKQQNSNLKTDELNNKVSENQDSQNNENKTNQNMESIFSNEVILKTTLGDIKVRLFVSQAPRTVANFTKLGVDGFYNGTRFHRVIKNFMIQGGDPLSKDISQKSYWGTGGPGYTFEDEINSMKLVRGSLAMANAGKNTNGSQFFIITASETPWLDGLHTNFGVVVEGMDIVEKIGITKTDSNDRPLEDVIIKEFIFVPLENK